MRVGGGGTLARLTGPSVNKAVSNDTAALKTRIAEKNGQQSLSAKSPGQLTRTEKNALPVSEKVVLEAIEKANKGVRGANARFEYSIHKATKQIMVKVIDRDTDEEIMQIPPEKILDMIAGLWDMVGLLVDEKR